MDAESSDAFEKLVQEKVSQLVEHFDSVRIFVSLHEGEDSTSFVFSRGGGNWYAQYGQILEWCHRQEERTRKQARKED